MKHIFDQMISNLSRIGVHGKEEAALMYNTIETLEKLRDMVKTETREIQPEVEKADETDNG
jgi:hypothetical protein